MSFSEEKLFEIKVTEVVRKLWPTLRPFAPRFSCGVLLILLTTAIEVATPILIGFCVDVAASPEKDRALLYRLCGLYLGLIACRAVFDTLQAYVIQSSGQLITHNLRCLLFSRIERLPVGYFDRNPTGRLLTRVINDIKSLSELFTASISVLALDIMVIAGTIVAMFWMHMRLAAVVLITFPLVVYTVKYFGLKLAFAYRSVRSRLSEINAFLGENIGAIATIQRLAAESSRYEKFDKIVARHQDAQMESLRVFALVQPLTNLMNGVAMGTLLIVGGYWVIHDQISVGIVVAFLGYLRNLFQPVRDLVEKYNTFLSAMVSAERVVGILDEKPEELTPSLLISAGADPEHVTRSEASLVFDKVTFQYPTRHTPALESVSFKLKAGQQLAVVGATGSGKSTLVRLLLKFYEPNSGEIRFGGKPLSEWSRVALRRSVGVVHQEIYLFQGTVRENLTLGREGFDDRYLKEQCERAQLWDFIKGRGGLDFHAYEGGSNLSIGERQLLSFARVLVFDTPVLVLDEATSSVDRRLERRLMEAIHEVLLGRTSVVIAHRLSTIQECESIIVLEKGKLVEQGSYDSLLNDQGLFRKFHDIHVG